uniref:Uncharacterized protein n=1 Tax=Panagrolaimus superbus TaxID=310955 RepID=A0A914YI75_9BILA
MKTQILIDWIALGFVAILTTILIILSIVTLTERDAIDGKIMCTKDYTETEMNAFKNSSDTKFLSCPTVFKTTSRCCWRYSFMATFLCFNVIVIIYLAMRTSCVEKLCNCTR